MDNDTNFAKAYVVRKGPAYLDDEIFHLLHDQLPQIHVSAEIDLCDDYNAGTGIIPHLSVTTNSIIRFVTCNLFSNVF